MAIAAGSGIEADLDPLVELRGGSGESCLFGEGPGESSSASRAIASTSSSRSAEKAGVVAFEIGSVGGDRLSLSAAERDVSVALTDAERAWRSLPERL